MSPFKGPAFADTLTALHKLCFAEPWSFDNFYKILNLPTTFGFGDEHGFILCADLGQDLEILTLAIHPNYRRKGYASMLLQQLQQFANEHNKEQIFLEVNATNNPAIQLYLKHHFVQTGCRKDYYHENGNTFDALCLAWKKSPTK